MVSLCSLFVGNLPPMIDLPSFSNYFIRAGNVQDFYIPSNQRQGLHRKYGFVRFNSEREAKLVAARCNGDFVWGNYIIVKPAARERRDTVNYHTQLHVEQRSKVRAPNTGGSKKFTPRARSGAQPSNVFTNLEYNTKESDLLWLSGCAVGHLSTSNDIYNLESQLHKQGIYCKLIYMGGKMVLLSFSEELMRVAIKEVAD